MSYSQQKKVLYYLGKYLEAHPERRNQLINYMQTNETQMPETVTTNAETENSATPTILPEINEVQTNKPEKATHKLTEEQFIAELELNLGLYTQTAQSIQRHYGIKYSRQAVFERAFRLNRADVNLKAMLMDNAKEILFDAMGGETDQKLKIKTAMFLLSNKASGNL